MKFTSEVKIPVGIQIEDEWLSTAGMSEFKPSDSFYHVSPQKGFSIIPLKKIKPPTPPGRKLERERFIRILEAFKLRIPLDPIEVEEIDGPQYLFDRPPIIVPHSELDLLNHSPV
jgi:hypothetical protein